MASMLHRRRRTAVSTAPGASPRWHRPPHGPCASRAGSLGPEPRSAGSGARGQSSSGKPDGDCRGNHRASRWHAGTRHGAATGVLNLSGEAGAQGLGAGTRARGRVENLAEGGSPACAFAAAKAHRCPGEGVARPLEAVIDTASPREPKLVYSLGAPAAPVPGQRELHGLVAGATLLGPPLQPQLPPLGPAPDVPAALNCFSPCLCWRCPACLVCLPGLPSTALSPTDSTSPLRLRLINPRPPGSPSSCLHLCGCAWFCTWFRLSFCKFLEGRGRILPCKAQCLAVVCVQ